MISTDNSLTDHLLNALATTDKSVTIASPMDFLGVFGFTDNLEERVQGLDIEPANGTSPEIAHSSETESEVANPSDVRNG